MRTLKVIFAIIYYLMNAKATTESQKGDTTSFQINSLKEATLIPGRNNDIVISLFIIFSCLYMLLLSFSLRMFHVFVASRVQAGVEDEPDNVMFVV